METARSEKQEVIQDIIGFDFTRLWATCRDLTVRPGQTIAAYCDGDRAKYISPITYFFLVYGIVFLLMNVLHLPDMLVAQGEQYGQLYEINRASQDDQSNKTISEINDRLIEFMKGKEASLIITFPIVILFQWLFYRRFRRSFFHNLYFVLFAFGHITLLTAPLIIPMAHPPAYKWSMLLMLIITFAYWIMAELRFYNLTLKQAIVRKLWQTIAMIVPLALWMLLVLIVVGLFFALEQ